MNAALSEPLSDAAFSTQNSIEESYTQRSSVGIQANVLADIYQENINIALWQRAFKPELVTAISEFVALNPRLSKSVTVSPSSAFEILDDATDGTAPKALLEDIAELVDMFCCLFELDDVGLRLATLHGAMCPRFHVDKVPCRLVTTYHGIATQWLNEYSLDRSKLGHASNGKPDSESGLYADDSDIQQMTCADVALLKGQSWIGNENTALVHRSPAVATAGARLLLTLDFA
ncbi:DUF1826 domain-containing protein [Shewanella sp. 10N.7]|uniref:DUF1826 domain-containing protein n=1 Tax=Shewanella sp. 10N.7 TaxID=2885093 RepID=UPI001E44DAF5|nr:DUF1826 domain-containing protein [Shewanella sp. 10N.7]MCC4832522.1 DUF1826 domain-containing protein [Shewanella sp. 10N.7]